MPESCLYSCLPLSLQWLKPEKVYDQAFVLILHLTGNYQALNQVGIKCSVQFKASPKTSGEQRTFKEPLYEQLVVSHI